MRRYADDEVHHAYLDQNFGIERFHIDVLVYNQIAVEIMNKKQIPVIDLYAFTLKFGEKPIVTMCTITNLLEK